MHSPVRSLSEYFEFKYEIPRIRVGNAQEIETLINEEALLFAMFLGDENNLGNRELLFLGIFNGSSPD
jgi:hypothetical protein